ncbi:MAG: hypothetical protein ACOH5I_20585 [Oligoflexus sp.]
MVLIEHWLNTLKDQMHDKVQSIMIERQQRADYPLTKKFDSDSSFELQKSSIKDYQNRLEERKERISQLQLAYQAQCARVQSEVPIHFQQRKIDHKRPRMFG